MTSERTSHSTGDGRVFAMKPSTVAFALANAALLFMAVFAICKFGSISSAACYYLTGERITVDADVKSFGVASPGETVRVSFNLTNRNDGEVRILGCKAACSCAVPSRLPITLAPDERRDLSLRIKLPQGRPATAGTTLNIPFTLFTSSGAQPRIKLSVKGELIDTPAGHHPVPDRGEGEFDE